jgi:hypothetical protein
VSEESSRVILAREEDGAPSFDIVQRTDTATGRTGKRDGGAARGAAAGAALIAVALLLVACGGGSSSPGVASIKSTSTPSSSSSSSSGSGAALSPGAAIPLGGGTGKQGLKFSACMRGSGVPNYPDPNATGQINLPSSIDVISPLFLAADKNCAKNIAHPTPSTLGAGKALAQGVAFAECMRSHGIKDFPDPQLIGGVSTIRLNTNLHADLDPGSPFFKRAARACQAVDPGEMGTLTPLGGS